MSDRSIPKNAQDTGDSASSSTIEAQEPQPESGFIDQEEHMAIRQSSPTNPRVNDKPEDNQEEA